MVPTTGCTVKAPAGGTEAAGRRCRTSGHRERRSEAVGEVGAEVGWRRSSARAARWVWLPGREVGEEGRRAEGVDGGREHGLGRLVGEAGEEPGLGQGEEGVGLM